MQNTFNGRNLVLETVDDVYDLREEGLIKFGSVAELSAWIDTVHGCAATGPGQIRLVKGNLANSDFRQTIWRGREPNLLFVAAQFYPIQPDFNRIRKLQSRLRAEQCALMVGFCAPDDSLTAEFANSQSPQVTW